MGYPSGSETDHDMSAIRISHSAVSIAVEGGRLVIEPQPRKRYSLQELLEQCDASAALSDEDNQWTASVPECRELI